MFSVVLNKINGIFRCVADAQRLLGEGNHILVDAQSVLEKLNNSPTLPSIILKLDKEQENNPLRYVIRLWWGQFYGSLRKWKRC